MGKKKSLTSLILLALEKSIDGYLKFEDFIYNPLLDRPVKKSALALAFKRLRENGLVELISNEQLIYRLSDSGKDKALWTKMIQENENWDGKWRIVIWDIPEKQRAARDLLRNKLKLLGFKQLQRSVWLTKKNCTQALRDFIKQIGIKDWVLVFETEEII